MYISKTIMYHQQYQQPQQWQQWQPPSATSKLIGAIILKIVLAVVGFVILYFLGRFIWSKISDTPLGNILSGGFGAVTSIFSGTEDVIDVTTGVIDTIPVVGPVLSVPIKVVTAPIKGIGSLF
jgi:uncharacterized membrane protein required for colicin V production